MSLTGALGVVMKPQQKGLLPRKDIQNYQRERCVNIESKHIKLLKTSASGEWSMGLHFCSCSFSVGLIFFKIIKKKMRRKVAAAEYLFGLLCFDFESEFSEPVTS